MKILHALQTMLWSFIGIEDGRKRGENFQSNPLIFIAIGFVLTLLFVGTLVIISNAMVESG